MKKTISIPTKSIRDATYSKIYSQKEIFNDDYRIDTTDVKIVQKTLDFVGELLDETIKDRLTRATKILELVKNSTQEIQEAYLAMLNTTACGFTSINRFTPTAAFLIMLLYEQDNQNAYQLIQENIALTPAESSAFQRDYFRYSQVIESIPEELKLVQHNLTSKLRQGLPITFIDIGAAPKIHGATSTKFLKKIIEGIGKVLKSVPNIIWYATDIEFPRYQFKDNQIVPQEIYQDQEKGYYDIGDGIRYIDVSQQDQWNFMLNAPPETFDLLLSSVVGYHGSHETEFAEISVDIKKDNLWLRKDYVQTIQNITTAMHSNSLCCIFPSFIDSSENKSSLSFDDVLWLFTKDHDHLKLLESVIPFELGQNSRQGWFNLTMHLNQNNVPIVAIPEHYQNQVKKISELAYYINYTQATISGGMYTRYTEIIHEFSKRTDQISLKDFLKYMLGSEFFQPIEKTSKFTTEELLNFAEEKLRNSNYSLKSLLQIY